MCLAHGISWGTIAHPRIRNLDIFPDHLYTAADVTDECCQIVLKCRPNFFSNSQTLQTEIKPVSNMYITLRIIWLFLQKINIRPVAEQWVVKYQFNYHLDRKAGVAYRATYSRHKLPTSSCRSATLNDTKNSRFDKTKKCRPVHKSDFSSLYIARPQHPAKFTYPNSIVLYFLLFGIRNCIVRQS